MNRWLRVVLPSWPQWIFTAVFAKVLFVAPGIYVYWVSGQIDEMVFHSNLLIFFGAIVVYAVYRGATFHPAFRTDYLRWLSLTPWTRHKALPLGPIHLVWQDAVVMSALMGLACWPTDFSPANFRPEWFVQTFIACYLFAVGVSLRVTGTWRWAYAVGFAFGLAVRLWHQPTFYFAAATGTYALAYVGLQRSLAEFPWNLNWIAVTLEQFRSRQGRFVESPGLGWQYESLSPKEADEFLVPRAELLCLASLAAWWLHVVLALIPDEANQRMWAWGAMILALAVLSTGRMLSYVVGYASPISVMGRLFTGRLIIPGYDQIFVAPALAMLACSIGLLALRFNPIVISPLTIFAVVAIVFGVGPSLRNWRLTGAHRIVPRSKQGLERVG